MKRWFSTIAAIGLLATGSVAQAVCNVNAWSSNSGAVISGGPDPSETNTLSRNSGICAMQVTAASSYVQDDSPTAEARMISRFYFLPSGGAGATDLLVAYSDTGATTAAFTVSFDGTSVTVTNGVGTTAPVAVNASKWNYVEVDWNTAGPTTSVWVNTDSSTAPAANEVLANTGPAASVETVRLGAPNTLGVNAITFDDYESRRSTAIGALPGGDANGDGNVNIFDAIGVVNEILNGTLGTGQPDCNLDGNINIFDAICIVNVILGN